MQNANPMHSHAMIVAGIGTEVGKTVVSAILVTLLKGEYWKPIQCGPKETSDTEVMKTFLCKNRKIHPPIYSLQAPLSPHHAAKMEAVTIDPTVIYPPQTQRPLIIEGIGGVMVPLRQDLLSIDLFKQWNCRWVLVCRHYLGSINHTLLTFHALQSQNIAVAGIVFNGTPHPESEEAILRNTHAPFLGRLLPEPFLNANTIQRYATQWKLKQHLLLS